MMRRPKLQLNAAERASVRRWTRRILGAWVTVVIVTLSLSLLGSERPEPARAPMAECSEMVCLQQAVHTGTARR